MDSPTRDSDDAGAGRGRGGGSHSQMSRSRLTSCPEWPEGSFTVQALARFPPRACSAAGLTERAAGGGRDSSSSRSAAESD